jgi:colicin import membrane protein
MTEGSVSFSLKELMRLEEERVALAREEARALEEEKRKRAEEEAFRAREVEEERLRLEDERRREEERRAREEKARLEGIERAIVERERTTVERAAHAAEMDRLRRHEIELVRLREGAVHPLGARTAWSASGALVMMLGACLVTYFAGVRPDNDRRLADARGEATERAAAVEAAQKRLDELGTRVQGLEGRLHDADLRAQDLERQLKDARDASKSAPARGRSAGPATGHGAKTDTPKGLLGGNCNPIDPLCSGK